MFGVSESSGVGRAFEPHVPVDRLADGAWVYAPVGQMAVTDEGRAVVCHACGEPLAGVSAAHARRHGLSLVAYRERFGLNRKTSLIAPALSEVRRVEGQRRWVENAAVREGLAVGQALARSGALYELGAAAQPAGTRRAQGRSAASREGASPALRADRERRSVAARQRWTVRVAELGFTSLEEYLQARRIAGVTAHEVRVELGCGGSTASRLLHEGA
ncbi:MAG: hypothetical protein CMH84_18320 [Nocardioides sp.]|nr:hypothetical protein [Nocardioides sp.]